MSTDYYYTDDELMEMVEKLNALTDEWHPWEWTHARKQHEDL